MTPLPAAPREGGYSGGVDSRRPLILRAAAPDDGHCVSPARSWLESGDSIVKPHDEKPTLQMESEAKYLSDQKLFLQPRGPVDHHGHRHVGCLFHQGRDEEPAVFADVE